MERIRVSAVLRALPLRVYDAWLSAKEHGAFTGSVATVDARVGGKFSAWDGYIHGETVELEPGKRIVQTWRSSDFPKSAPTSRLEVLLKKDVRGTKITLVHSDIPSGQGAEYKKGWVEFYFAGMKKYFNDVPKKGLKAKAKVASKVKAKRSKASRSAGKRSTRPSAR